MACYWLFTNETVIKIPDVFEKNGITFYNIEVQVGDFTWFVKRRYNDFFELHIQLVCNHGVSKDLLPPKKVILNKSKAFIQSRREALEIYLQNILNYLKRAMPKEFWEFLDFQEYDIYFLLQYMACNNFSNSFNTTNDNEHKFTTLQLHAVSECLKRPVLELSQMGNAEENACDLSNILDCFSQLSSVKIYGSNKPYKDSNIIPNNLGFEMSSFKNLKNLVIYDSNLENIYNVDNLRNTLQKLEVHQSQVVNVSNILQCDTVHKKIFDGKQQWTQLTEIDFSCNNINEVDVSIQLAPLLVEINLSCNKLTNFPNLSCLTNLKLLNLSQNLISNCENLHTVLGNVINIDLSQNRLTSLHGFSKLYSLENLNVSHNNIIQIEDVKCIGDLPCLEEIVLNGNPIATTVDYRVKILETFGERRKEILLDNEKANQSELDKASVLRALKIAKDSSRLSRNE